jgi:hypothetical protein
MWEDPIVKEVRRIRKEIEEECDNDFRKIYEYALQIQEEDKRKRAKGSESKPSQARKSLVAK